VVVAAAAAYPARGTVASDFVVGSTCLVEALGGRLVEGSLGCSLEDIVVVEDTDVLEEDPILLCQPDRVIVVEIRGKMN
jgi:hypothetical protein